MEEKRAIVGIVIKQDGTVPFDADCPDHIRGHILAHLTDLGHSIEPVHGTRHVRVKDWNGKLNAAR